MSDSLMDLLGESEPSKPKRSRNKKKVKGNYKPTVGQWRISLVASLIWCAAIGLVVSDAIISWYGFDKISLSPLICIVLTLVIFVVQLGVGILHSLGVNFTELMGDSGDDWGESFWKWVLIGVYFLDISSNMITMNVFESFWMIPTDIWGGLGGIFLAIAGGTLLTFADEMLFRLHDKISIESKANKYLAKRMVVEQTLSETYLREMRSLAKDKAKLQAQSEGNSWTFGDHL